MAARKSARTALAAPRVQTHEHQYSQINCEPISKSGGPAIGPNLVSAHDRAQQLSINAMAADTFIRQLPRSGDMAAFTPALQRMVDPNRAGDFEAMRGNLEKAAAMPNAIARAFRENPRHYQTVAPGHGGPRMLPTAEDMAKSAGMAKANLDVGTLTNFAQITGGQSLGYVSLDTRIARGTVRPDSYTLYQALPKSAAFQVVDYWTYIDDPGGPLPGAAFQGFSNVGAGTLTTDAGIYALQNITLKLALDGRAVTTALMAQNNFVDVVAQENANAALTVLNSVNWASYWGNPVLYPNQPVGLAASIPAGNTFNFQTFYANNATLQGWSQAQAIYNLIYEASAVITSWGKYGRISHAFMTPLMNGAMQGLVTTTLNNLLNVTGREPREMAGIVVDGDLQGMRTRMGTIAFPLDIFITARETPAQAQPRSNGTTPATTVGPTPPTGIALTVATGTVAANSAWGYGAGSPYVAGSGIYMYAVASTDSYMNESVLTYSAASVSGVPGTGAYAITIAPPAAADATSFRVYRSGLGQAVSGSPTAYRYVGTVAASGSSNVTFIDYNQHIPGSETIFLLDLVEEDGAIDYRFLLPLTRIELFAQNLYMPWAVATIGSIRNKIPKFSGLITNITIDNPSWNPLGSNN